MICLNYGDGKPSQICMVRVTAFDTLKADSCSIATETMIEIGKALESGSVQQAGLFALRDQLVAERTGVHNWVSKAAAKRPAAAVEATPADKKKKRVTAFKKFVHLSGL